MKRGSRVLAPILIGLAFWACGNRPVRGRPEITVAAAADLEQAFTDIAQGFEKQSGIRVTLSFGASGSLTKQIENGAPFDVFAAANVAYVDQLAKEGFIQPGSERVYAQGQLVLWQRKDSKVQVNSLTDLAAPAVSSVAIANPEHAPYGIAAVQALTSAGIYNAVASKLVRGENILQALQFVETGNADVGIIALSISDRPDGRWTVIDKSLYKPLKQAIAVVRSTHSKTAARLFVDFLQKPEATSVLEHYGLAVARNQE